MELIAFLVKTLEVLGLIFLIGILINLIIDVIIIRPIYIRATNKQKIDLMDSTIKQVKSGDLKLEQLEEIRKAFEKGIEK